jgi:CRISPR/Cas system-associated exonuclease Cas4 (RecB family)
MWSVSEAKTFRRCPRQWYFKHRLASPKATKQADKRTAYLLGSLQSVAAWRGQVVDVVVEHVIVPALVAKRLIPLRELLVEARSIFDRQLAFARASRAHEPGMTKTKAGNDFAALLVVEEKGDIADADVTDAWADVDQALRNLHSRETLWAKLLTARRLLPQYTIWHQLCGHQIRAIPDLIAFFHKDAPLILDWKVHYAGIRDSAFQLETYALALVRSDSVDRGCQWKETDIRLAEVQLLTGQVRHYRLSEEKISAVENEILASISEIELCINGKERDDLQPLDLPATRYAENCAACGFKKLCWNNDHDHRN